MTLPTIEGFRVLGELGEGALSIVYRAHQEPLGRVVAIKLQKPSIHAKSSFAAQFEREAHILAELLHPNITTLLGFTKTERRTFLVLEYVDGPTLAEVLAKREKVPPEMVAAVGHAVASGLAHAHERGIVHRDIKPSNIVLSKRGDLKITDFGAAQRLAHEPASAPLHSIGTPAYMSPEQLLGDAVDARSDLFSLGVVMYQLLSGARPYERGDDSDREARLSRLRKDPPIPLHRRAPETPRALERIVMRLIEKHPGDRFPSAASLRDHLEEFLDDKAPRESKARLIAGALVIVGLLPPDELGLVSQRQVREPRDNPSRPLAVALTTAALVFVSGSVIRWTDRDRDRLAPSLAMTLPLAPPSSGGARFVVKPWAEVHIDGQYVDTTPFSREIPLAPGRHFIELRHPSAAKKTMEIQTQAGVTEAVHVDMGIGGDRPAAPRATPSVESEGASP